MTMAHDEAPRGIHTDTCSTCCATGAELTHIRFTDDSDIRRRSECGSQNKLGIRVHARPGEVAHPGAN
ncbi:hypothetical protein ACH4LT_31770 [Streptomyces clavifer]|jgi:hypothetical protein|uniref:hypothetical protein n=1 Tax=Streptomyces clavifer TaxID=68188 RepID=UPI0037B00752